MFSSFLIIAGCLGSFADAFALIPQRPFKIQRRNPARFDPSSEILLHPVTCNDVPVSSSSTSVAAVDTFDGGQIVDSVVVSGVFWASLRSRFVNYLVVNGLSVGLFVTFAPNLISKAADWANREFAKNDNSLFSKFVPTPSDTPKRSYSDLPPPDFSKLLICVAIDIIGSSNELVPVLGEVVDVIWAPLAASFLKSLFGGSNVVFILEFAEEILPLTDVLPLATICWVVDTFLVDSELAKLLQLGIYRVDDTLKTDESVIDTVATSSDESRRTEKKI